MPTLATSINAKIRHAIDEFEAAFERSDAAASASLPTSNGLLLPTGMEAIQGSAGIPRKRPIFGAAKL